MIAALFVLGRATILIPGSQPNSPGVEDPVDRGQRNPHPEGMPEYARGILAPLGGAGGGDELNPGSFRPRGY